MSLELFSRRNFLAATAATSLSLHAARRSACSAQPADGQARIAITFDLEMSRHYPQQGMLEWDYQKGNLDEATKKYAVRAGEIVREFGGLIHYFCVGRTLEQADVSWLKGLAEAGHPIGNHTYDHVNVKAQRPEQTQFRFQRSPWLIAGQSTQDIIRENVRITNAALRERAEVDPNGFRTPGGFSNGLEDAPSVRSMLQELGFSWISSKYPTFVTGHPEEPPTELVYQNIVAAQQQAQPFQYADGLIEIPMSPISDVHAFRSLRWKLTWFLASVRRCVTWAIETGNVFDFLCHPSCMLIEDPEFQTIRLIGELVREARDKASIVGLDTIAQCVRSSHPD